MKKTLLLTLALSISFSSLWARDYKNEFSVSYGQFTVPQFGYLVGGVLGVAFTAGHFTFENTKMFGAAGFEYEHYTNDWFAFGCTVLCDYMTADSYNKASDGTKTYNGKFNLGFMSLMPNVKFSWFNREKVSLYSKLAFGAGLVFDNGDSAENNFSPAFQVTPIGVDFGKGSFRGFAELGVGMQGVLCAGVRKSF